MGATIEWLQGCVRTGPAHIKFGDEYTFTAIVTRVRDTAHLSGGCSWFDEDSPEMWPVKELLKAEGFSFAEWERYQPGKPIRYIRVKL